ncbi:MAG: hypothetical protein WDZ59_06245 [Pirellulales bacterium]
MRRASYAMAVLVAMIGGTGCCPLKHYLVHGGDCGACVDCGGGAHLGGAGCTECAGGLAGAHGDGSGGHPLLHHHGPPATLGQQGGPPSGTVSYPYYTTRGPRDFLQKNPPGLGR